jgi:hypothetical protein
MSHVENVSDLLSLKYICHPQPRQVAGLSQKSKIVTTLVLSERLPDPKIEFVWCLPEIAIAGFRPAIVW